MFFHPASARWRTVEARVLSSRKIAPQSGMTQVGDRLVFGPKGSLSVAGQRYQLRVEYAVDGQTFTPEFTMICDEVPSRLILAYDPADPSKWDWPEDRTLEGE